MKNTLLLILVLLLAPALNGQNSAVRVGSAVDSCVDAGGVNAYACNLSPAIASYVTGGRYRFRASSANTAAATIQYNGIAGPVTIKKVAGGITTDLAADDIRSGQWVDLVFDGTNMQMQSTLGNTPASATALYFLAARTTAAILTLGTDCSPSAPCNFRFGNVAYSITSSATVTLAAGAGTGAAYIYVTAGGVLTVGHNLTNADVTCNGCTKAAGVTAFPADSIPLYIWTVTTDTWDVSGGVDFRAYLSTKKVVGAAGGNINVGETGGTSEISVGVNVVLNGVDINSSNQVTATHLAAALPIAQGGTAQTSVPGSSGNYIYNNSGAYGAKAIAPTRAIGCGVGDPAGSALSTGVLCYVVAPATCTIQSWDILVDSGTATADIWKIATGTAIPTVSNSIVASAAPAISAGTAIHSTTMTAWTTAVTKYDIFGFNLTATSGPKYIYVGVNCDETL